LQDRAIYFRNDLAFAANNATPKNPHTFPSNLASGGLAPQVAVGAQTQIAIFCATNGATTIDPDGPGACLKCRSLGHCPKR
jgi:hypothetical protein